MAVTQRQLDNYIGSQGAADLLGLTAARVIQLADAGRIPHLRTPIGRLYPRHEIEALAAQRNAVKEGSKAA